MKYVEKGSLNDVIYESFVEFVQFTVKLFRVIAIRSRQHELVSADDVQESYLERRSTYRLNRAVMGNIYFVLSIVDDVRMDNLALQQI